ncbi:antA/AntB antirepressor family protein [Asaia lannensis]|uniref:antA/AntB antirepressor family protein n=1 Tax=Asaia lannensis TaxID=415421 RepID=UPI003872C860
MDRDLIIPPEFAAIAAICVATEGTIGSRKCLTVDGRALHAGLKVGRTFGAWLPSRIESYGFQEDSDYEILLSNSGKQNGSGGHNLKDYRLTTDMAKELAMIENNEMGRLARRYFIWREQCAMDALTAAPRTDRYLIPGVVMDGIDETFIRLHRAAKELGMSKGRAFLYASEGTEKLHGFSLSDLLVETVNKLPHRAETPDTRVFRSVWDHSNRAGLPWRWTEQAMVKLGLHRATGDRSCPWEATPEGERYAKVVDKSRKGRANIKKAVYWTDDIVPMVEAMWEREHGRKAVA